MATSSPKKNHALICGQLLVERLVNGGAEVDRRRGHRWDGAHWRTASAPKIDGALLDVAAAAPDDVRAIACDDPVTGGNGATIAHWDGKVWRTTKLPPRDVMNALATDGRTRLWDGTVRPANPIGERETIKPRPLIEQYGC